ncbi:MAG: energy-coupling factor transporter transmembrane component T family protein [Tractidigestivibacter sp.]|jgi:energy-coupling factor transport system permease protein|uniref:energy-coupling factor transporter transmembrane component T family protein n=1 Tax=Tractidigestivibacter sp. TaxID=2847320 RepID=UPI003D8F0395
MALRISIGQYYDADSPIHSLDPRTKLWCALGLMIATFFVHSGLELALLVALTLALIGCAHIPASEVLKSVRSIFWILLILAVFNLLLIRTGDTIFSYGIITITTDSLWSAILYPIRVLACILFGALLLLTTTPTELGDAFDATCAPLTKLGLPGHELAMVFSLMLRFIPTLANDASAIVDAQVARGGELSTGKFGKRIQALGSVIVALLASSMNHADDLARALDARCYEGGAARSHWHPMHFSARDAIAGIVSVALFALFVVLG